jgi:hypothetical protein
MVSDELLERKNLHVGSLCQALTESCLARALGSNQEKDAWKHCLSGLSIDFINRVTSIYPSDLAELLVKFNNWL